MIFSCKSTPAPAVEIPQTEEIVLQEETEEPEFSEELYLTTMDEVRSFIEELNKIISARNYNAWVQMLSPEYFTEISSSAFLAGISERLPGNIVLRTARDYFDRIVVPSRRTSQLDDIEFLDRDRVIAFSYSMRGEELRREILFNLIKIDNQWKIVN